MPESMDGRNGADFVDPDIEAQLAQLEKEEDALAAAAALEVWRLGMLHSFACVAGHHQHHSGLCSAYVTAQPCVYCALQFGLIYRQ